MSGSRSAIAFVALAAVIAVGASGCRVQPAMGGDWPAGTLVVARTAALAQLLARLQRVEGTPLARRAAAVAASLPDCEWLEGRSETGPTDVWSRLACRSGAGELAGLDGERGDRDIAFALPEDRGGRIVGVLDVGENGDVDADVLLPPTAFTDARALMLPSGEAPGPTRLSHADELVHARLRPKGGIDVASLVPASGQADQLFRLKSEIFSGTVLDGTWEVAIYLPESGRMMPLSALAIGFSLKAPAVAAMEDFVSELEATWPVRRSDFAVAEDAGACLLDLKLLPELAPCYVATETALVVGWNPASLRKALNGAGDARRQPHPESGISVDFGRFPEADTRLSRAADPDRPPILPDALPWRTLVAGGSPDGDGVRLRVRLDGGAGA